MMKKGKPKMLLFSRDFKGYSVDPHSVIAWLYYNKAPKLAEHFCKSLDETMGELEKNWQKNKITTENKLKELSSSLKEDVPKGKELPKLKWWQKL